ncbi:unnamed protein product [Sphagnum tenellum]
MGARVLFASEIQFAAEVDEMRIPLDGNVALKLTIRSDQNSNSSDPQFNAPDFDIVGESKSVSIVAGSGVGITNTQQITKVLRPRKAGALKISAIQLNAEGKIFHAPDIEIQVDPNSGSGGSGGTGSGGAGARQSGRLRLQGGAGNLTEDKAVGASGAFLKAEINKKTAHKGEQVIVSYYLYHRVKIFNIQVEKFPILNGFLREDLEMPVMGQHLNAEQVLVGGVPYERLLLAKYAAYPLEEGKLSIDSMSLRYNYYSGGFPHNREDEDPFFGFFQQMAPRVATSQSERLQLTVVPLPTEGRTDKFTGGIGDFNVISTVDKYEVRANEAITLSVKVEGRGNISAIQAPQAVWPKSVELYDTKGKAQGGSGGKGEKIFEFLLIPRVPGPLHLPSLEFQFFDPVKNQYYSKSTEAVEIKVLDPAPGSPLIARAHTDSQDASLPAAVASSGGGGTQPQKEIQEPRLEELRYLKPPESGIQSVSLTTWILRVLYGVSGCLLIWLTALIGKDLIQGGRNRLGLRLKARNLRNAKSWEVLTQAAQSAVSGAPWNEVTHAYEVLSSVILDALDHALGLSSQALSRSELESILMPQEEWKGDWARVKSLLDFADLARFSSSAGSVSEETFRRDLAKWVQEGRSLVKKIEDRRPTKV